MQPISGISCVRTEISKAPIGRRWMAEQPRSEAHAYTVRYCPIGMWVHMSIHGPSACHWRAGSASIRAIEGTFTNGHVWSANHCGHCSCLPVSHVISADCSAPCCRWSCMWIYRVCRSQENPKERQAFLCSYVSGEFEGRYFTIWKSASLWLNGGFTGFLICLRDTFDSPT